MIGCLEGVFAMGQVYVLISRVTDPRNMLLIGLPPKDMLEDIAQALVQNGHDPDEVFERACNVTQEWEYDRSATLLRHRCSATSARKRSR